MSFIDEPGHLSEVPLAAVLLEALNHRTSGVLTIEHGSGESRIYLRAGAPVGAQSFGGFRPLGRALLEAGLIDMPALSESLAEIARSKRPQGEVLVEMGVVTREEVDRALTQQQEAYLKEIAALSTGRFRLEAGAAIPAWTDGVRISPFKAIVETLDKPRAAPLVISALQPAATGLVALSSGHEELAAAFGWSEPEAALVARLREPIALEAFFENPGIEPERARAILAALLLLGLAAPREAPAEEREPPSALVVDLANLTGPPGEAELEVPPWPAAPTGAAPGAIPHGSPGRPAMSGTASPPGGEERPSQVRRRGDPEEARRRRQRLLQRAMQNMGVGPLSGQVPAGRATPGSGTEPSARAGQPNQAGLELRRALQAAIPRSRAVDLFERLDLPKTATREQVKAAYLALAKQFHPDRFASPSLADLAVEVKNLFSAVNEAYETLSDDRKRAAYLARAGGGGGGGGKQEQEQAAVDFQKAEACQRTRDFGKARSFYESALRRDPRGEYQAAYAWALLQDPAGDRVRAKGLAEAALRDPSCLDRAALVCAVLSREEGDEERAERLLRRALKTNPHNLDAERELRALEARHQKGPGGPRRR